jgi:hypothetical protein
LKRSLNPGDLVKYRKDPSAAVPHIIPEGKEPIGMVLAVSEKLIGSDADPDTMSYMSVVLVMWAERKWNSNTGFSEEYYQDLVLVQGCERMR